MNPQWPMNGYDILYIDMILHVCVYIYMTYYKLYIKNLKKYVILHCILTILYY